MKKKWRGDIKTTISCSVKDTAVKGIHRQATDQKKISEKHMSYKGLVSKHTKKS